MDARNTASVGPTQTLEATIFRADGTVEELGVIARTHRTEEEREFDRVRGMGDITTEVIE